MRQASFAPPSYESLQTFLDKLQELSSPSYEESQNENFDQAPVYSELAIEQEKTTEENDVEEKTLTGKTKGFEYTVAQNQVTLVHDNPNRDIIEKIDTEQHLTIRQIREFLCSRLNVDRVQLFYRTTLLTDNNLTLADHGWVPGECGTISVKTNALPNVLYSI